MNALKIPRLTTPPTLGPITLAQAKDHVRVSSGGHDVRLQGAIWAATDWAQRYTRRQFVTGTYTLKYDGFPGGGGTIELPNPPLVSVTTFSYTDPDGVVQTLAEGTGFDVVTSEPVARVCSPLNGSWPGTQSGPETVEIVYQAGYGAPGDVPEAIRSALLMRVADLFENPDAASVDKLHENRTASMLLDMYRLVEVY